MPRECSTLARAAFLSFVAACAGTLYAAEPPASTAVDQRGAVLRFEGKLGPDHPNYRKDFEAFRLRFGPGDWAGTTINATSAWGMGRASTFGVGPAERPPNGPRSSTTIKGTISSFTSIRPARLTD